MHAHCHTHLQENVFETPSTSKQSRVNNRFLLLLLRYRIPDCVQSLSANPATFFHISRSLIPKVRIVIPLLVTLLLSIISMLFSTVFYITLCYIDWSMRLFQCTQLVYITRHKVYIYHWVSGVGRREVSELRISNTESWFSSVELLNN
jgi:hypothetical protein